jgi:hypothetical protein
MIDAFDRFWTLLAPTTWQRSCMVGWCLVALGSLTLLVLRRPAARGAARPFWVMLAILGPLGCLEMGLSLRYEAMSAVRSLVQEAGGSEAVQGRRPWQAALVLATLAVSAVLMGVVARSFRRWTAPARLAAAGLLISLTGFALELISLHQLDAHYGVYFSLWLGGLAVMLSAIAWAGATGVAAVTRPARGPDDGMGSRTYRVPGVAAEPADPSEPIEVRLLRLACIGLLLAIPEIAAWLSL